MSEDEVDGIVRKWVEDNYAEFNEGSERCGKPLFRENIYARCRKYKNAPDEYLKTMLKTLQEAVKWYFNIFHTVFIAGTLGFLTTLLILFISNFVSWWKEFQDWSSLSIWLISINWLIPLDLSIIIIVSSLKTNKKSRSPYLSNLIQTKFYILHNMKEIQIEMYYISNILKIRDKEERTTKGQKKEV